MVALTVDPVGPSSVVTGVVFLDQFERAVCQDVVRQLFQPMSFHCGSTVGVMLTGPFVNHLECVIDDCIDQGLTAPQIELLGTIG